MKVRSNGVAESKNFLVGGCSPVSHHAPAEHELESVEGLLRTCCTHLQMSTRSLAWFVQPTAVGPIKVRCHLCSRGFIEDSAKQRRNYIACKLAIDA